MHIKDIIASGRTGERKGRCKASLLKSLAFCAIVACAAGCAHSKFSSQSVLAGVDLAGTDQQPRQMVMVNTTGYYLFWSIPLVSGDLDWDDGKKDIKGGFSFFSDSVEANKLQDALFKIAKSRNCDVIDVQFSDSDTSYAGPSYEGAVGVIFGSSQMGISGVLVPRATVKGEVK